MNYLKVTILLAILTALSSCNLLFKSLTPPTSKDLEAADYGSPPATGNKEVMRGLVVKRLKDVGYFDPNSAEVEDCSIPEKHWEYSSVNSTMDKTGYSFGWRFLCDVNVKNRLGGYTGFRRSDFLYYNGNVIGSDQFYNGHTVYPQ
jgi:hypothetical protein